MNTYSIDAQTFGRLSSADQAEVVGTLRALGDAQEVAVRAQDFDGSPALYTITALTRGENDRTEYVWSYRPASEWLAELT